MKIEKDVKKIIENNPVALATADKEGKPNVIAVAYVKVESDKVVITDNYMSHTKNNILANKSVCLAVWDKGWKGYKIIGKAKYYNSGKWRDYVKSLEENKGYPAKGAIVISIEKIRRLC